MTGYIIRTDKDERKTYIYRAGTIPVNIGVIYTDFNLYRGIRDITIDDVVNPKNNKPLADVRIFQDGNILSVNQKEEELSALSLQGDYKEKGIIIPHKRVTGSVLLSGGRYKGMEGWGVTHAYFLGYKSPIAQVFCFDREEEISGVVYTRNHTAKDDSAALKALALVLAQRISDQDYIFEFLRK